MSKRQQESLDSRHLWAEMITDLSPKERREIRDSALKRLKMTKRPGDLELYKELTSGQYDFLGFAPFMVYNRTDGDAEELEADWKHKFGRVTLVYGGKKKACVLFVNAYLRVNHSILNEFKGNQKVSMLGQSG